MVFVSWCSASTSTGQHPPGNIQRAHPPSTSTGQHPASTVCHGRLVGAAVLCTRRALSTSDTRKLIPARIGCFAVRMDPELLAVLHRQGGVVAAAALRTAVGRARMQQWLAAGQVSWIGRSWLQVGVAQPDLVSRIARVRAQIKHPVIACSHTAAELYGFGVICDDRIHLTTATGRSLAAPDGVVLHQAIPRSPWRTLDGIDIVDAADCVMDAAASVEDVDVLAVLDAAASRGATLHALTAASDAAAGRRGQRAVCLWLPHVNGLSGSPMESRTRTRLLRAGLPAPELQIEVATSSGARFLDLGWRQYRVGVDYEGEEFHTGDGRMAEDRRRHNDVTDSGWRMFYPTASDVYIDHRNFVAMIERALRTAGWNGPLTPLVVDQGAQPPTRG